MKTGPAFAAPRSIPLSDSSYSFYSRCGWSVKGLACRFAALSLVEVDKQGRLAPAGPAWSRSCRISSRVSTHAVRRA
jgi:hypothetical protein